MTLKLKIIIGSIRPGRVGPTVAAWVDQAARAHAAFDVELVDLDTLALPLIDESSHPAAQNYTHDHTRRWSAIVDEADAVVLVTPEYDYFAPANLVNAVQVLYREWTYKAAGIVSYGGVSGGLCSSQTLRRLLSNVGVMAIPQVVPVPFFAEFIDDDGVFSPNDKMSEGATLMFDELAKWASALKPVRAA